MWGGEEKEEEERYVCVYCPAAAPSWKQGTGRPSSCCGSLMDVSSGGAAAFKTNCSSHSLTLTPTHTDSHHGLAHSPQPAAVAGGAQSPSTRWVRRLLLQLLTLDHAFCFSLCSTFSSSLLQLPLMLLLRLLLLLLWLLLLLPLLLILLLLLLLLVLLLLLLLQSAVYSFICFCYSFFSTAAAAAAAALSFLPHGGSIISSCCPSHTFFLFSTVLFLLSNFTAAAAACLRPRSRQSG